jgi:hypothetical protein
MWRPSHCQWDYLPESTRSGGAINNPGTTTTLDWSDRPATRRNGQAATTLAGVPKAADAAALPLGNLSTLVHAQYASTI